MAAKQTRNERARSTAAQLRKLLPSAVRDIRRKVLRRRFHPEVPALDIELHFDGRKSRFLAYEMDGHGGQFSRERNGQTFIGGVYPVLSKALRFPGVEFDELEAPLARWFREAWGRAGGARFPLRTTFRVHDDIKEHLLAKGSKRPRRRAPNARSDTNSLRGLLAVTRRPARENRRDRVARGLARAQLIRSARRGVRSAAGALVLVERAFSGRLPDIITNPTLMMCAPRSTWRNARCRRRPTAVPSPPSWPVRSRPP